VRRSGMEGSLLLCFAFVSQHLPACKVRGDAAEPDAKGIRRAVRRGWGSGCLSWYACNYTASACACKAHGDTRCFTRGRWQLVSLQNVQHT
jgi:hypothetical protein